MNSCHLWNIKLKTLVYWVNRIRDDPQKRRAVLDLFWHVLDAKPSYLRRVPDIVDICTRHLHVVYISHREDMEVKEVVEEWKSRFGRDATATPQIGYDNSMPSG